MKEKEFENILDKYANTSGHKKFRNYIREIFKSDYFQDFVKKIRPKYKIPAKGFSSENGQIFPPVAWELRDNSEETKSFREEIKRVCKKYKIHLLDGTDIFENYIFYNDTDYVIDFGGYGMFLTVDIPQEKEEPWSKDVKEDDDLLYPIAVRISPHASLRDILDYIKTTYPYQISFLQKKYKDKDIKLGKFKKRKSIIQERNEFIYQNRDLPRQEIMKLVTDKFGSKNIVDYGYIGKIISLEKKKRKEL